MRVKKVRWGRAGEGRRGNRILGQQEVGGGGGSDVRFVNLWGFS